MSGYREGITLTDADALAAVAEAAEAVVRATLDARLSLLELGFADHHQVPLELDVTAREYAEMAAVARRQEREL